MDRGSSEDEDEQTGADKKLSTSSNPARHNNKLATMKANSVVSNGSTKLRSNFYGSPHSASTTAGEINIRWKEPGRGSNKTAAVNGSSSSSSYEKIMSASGTSKMKLKTSLNTTSTEIDQLTTARPRPRTIKVLPSTSATPTSGDALGVVHGSSSSGTGNLRSRSSSSSQPSTAAQLHQAQQISTKDQLEQEMLENDLSPEKSKKVDSWLRGMAIEQKRSERMKLPSFQESAALSRKDSLGKNDLKLKQLCPEEFVRKLNSRYESSMKNVNNRDLAEMVVNNLNLSNTFTPNEKTVKRREKALFLKHSEKEKLLEESKDYWVNTAMSPMSNFGYHDLDLVPHASSSSPGAGAPAAVVGNTETVNAKNSVPASSPGGEERSQQEMLVRRGEGTRSSSPSAGGGAIHQEIDSGAVAAPGGSSTGNDTNTMNNMTIKTSSNALRTANAKRNVPRMKPSGKFGTFGPKTASNTVNGTTRTEAVIILSPKTKTTNRNLDNDFLESSSRRSGVMTSPARLNAVASQTRTKSGTNVVNKQLGKENKNSCSPTSCGAESLSLKSPSRKNFFSPSRTTGSFFLGALSPTSCSPGFNTTLSPSSMTSPTSAGLTRPSWLGRKRILDPEKDPVYIQHQCSAKWLKLITVIHCFQHEFKQRLLFLRKIQLAVPPNRNGDADEKLFSKYWKNYDIEDETTIVLSSTNDHDEEEDESCEVQRGDEEQSTTSHTVPAKQDDEQMINKNTGGSAKTKSRDEQEHDYKHNYVQHEAGRGDYFVHDEEPLDETFFVAKRYLLLLPIRVLKQQYAEYLELKKRRTNFCDVYFKQPNTSENKEQKESREDERDIMMNNAHPTDLVPTRTTLEVDGHHAQDLHTTGRDDAVPSRPRLVHDENANDPPQDELVRARATGSANSARNNSNSSTGGTRTGGNDVVSCCSTAPVALQLKQQIHDGDEENVDERKNSTGFTGGVVDTRSNRSLPDHHDHPVHPTSGARTSTKTTSATTTPSSILTKLRLLNAFLVRRFLVVQLRRKRRIQVVYNCLNHWKILGRLMLAFKQYYAKIRRVQSWWKEDAGKKLAAKVQRLTNRWTKIEYQIVEKKLLALEDHSAPGASTTTVAGADRGRVNYKQGGATRRRGNNIKNLNGSSSVAQANQKKNPIHPGSCNFFYKDNNHTSGTSSTVKLRNFNTSLAGGSTGGRAGGGAAGYSTSKAGNLSTSSTSAVQSSKVQKMLQLDFSERVQLAMVSEPVRTKFIKQHLRQLRTSDYLPKVKNWEKLFKIYQEKLKSWCEDRKAIQFLHQMLSPPAASSVSSSGGGGGRNNSAPAAAGNSTSGKTSSKTSNSTSSGAGARAGPHRRQSLIEMEYLHSKPYPLPTGCGFFKPEFAISDETLNQWITKCRNDMHGNTITSITQACSKSFYGSSSRSSWRPGSTSRTIGSCNYHGAAAGTSSTKDGKPNEEDSSPSSAASSTSSDDSGSSSSAPEDPEDSDDPSDAEQNIAATWSGSNCISDKNVQLALRAAAPGPGAGAAAASSAATGGGFFTAGGRGRDPSAAAGSSPARFSSPSPLSMLGANSIGAGGGGSVPSPSNKLPGAMGRMFANLVLADAHDGTGDFYGIVRFEIDKVAMICRAQNGCQLQPSFQAAHDKPRRCLVPVCHAV
ncbi:unnamed protein product [Amoebophrya sp. A120]|nr:unnamed protein product [Amoebophrya sp. A120]|eukprot:GSA120T00010071001.1